MAAQLQRYLARVLAARLLSVPHKLYQAQRGDLPLERALDMSRSSVGDALKNRTDRNDERENGSHPGKERE